MIITATGQMIPTVAAVDDSHSGRMEMILTVGGGDDTHSGMGDDVHNSSDR